jgi:hypothetical protein
MSNCTQKQPAANSMAEQKTMLSGQASLDSLKSYLSQQPDASLYVLDSAEVIDADTHWQILVPRTDWANRMPNRAAFEVDKQSGTLRIRPVK